MKQYIRLDPLEQLYVCDPQKNKECRKTSCQTDCFYTTQKECSIGVRAGKVGRAYSEQEKNNRLYALAKKLNVKIQK